MSPWTESQAVAGHAAPGVSRTPSALGSSCGPCLGRAGPCAGQPSERILPYGCATYCKDSCFRHVLPSMTDVAFPNSEQLWPSALWRKETVLRVQAAEHPPWKCPPLLSSLQQTCLHCSLTFSFYIFTSACPCISDTVDWMHGEAVTEKIIQQLTVYYFI